MKYPKLNEIPYTRDLLDKFKGYNHNLRIGEGEFYDMKNLTGDDYPVLSPRKKRGIAITTGNANGMCSNTQFCYVDGQYFYIGSEPYDLKLTNDAKTLISMGANVVVMPDQKYINTVDPSVRGNIRNGIFELPNTGADGSTPKIKITITGLESLKRVVVSKKDSPLGDDIDKLFPKATYKRYKDEDCATMVITPNRIEWYRIAEYKHTDEEGTWYSYSWKSGTGFTINVNFNASIPTARVKISLAEGDEENWNTTLEQIKAAMGSDSIYLNGLVPSGDNKAIKVDISNNEILIENKNLPGGGLDYYKNYEYGLKEFLFGRTTPAEINTPYIKEGILAITAPYNAESTIPLLDHLIESGNRLWGCRYGTNNDGEWVNEVYATKLGDFKVWFKYDGVSTDSWTASVGTSGAFTGAINYGGKPIFFKEDCMHRVFGDYVPYSLQMIPCKGVQEGCAKSLAIVNDVLYYKSTTGVCAYDGSLPVEISTNFGDKQYKNAVGGAIGNKYYLSMQDEADEWHLFVYDTIKKMWHKEDDTQVTQFCNHKGELYYIDYSDKFIHSIKGTGVKETEPIPWYAETGILGATTPDDKYVTKIDMRMSVAKGSKMLVYIEYDSMGDWEKLVEIEGLTLNTFTIPVRPRRCDHFRLKFEGVGDAKIYSISKTMEETE